MPPNHAANSAKTSSQSHVELARARVCIAHHRDGHESSARLLKVAQVLSEHIEGFQVQCAVFPQLIPWRCELRIVWEFNVFSTLLVDPRADELELDMNTDLKTTDRPVVFPAHAYLLRLPGIEHRLICTSLCTSRPPPEPGQVLQIHA